MYIYKAAVVGAGTMGGGIAQVISYSGLPVIIKDIDEERAKTGLVAARKIYQSRVDKGKMTSGEMENKMALISISSDYKDFSDVDIVIEAVPENMEIKKSIFKELGESCPDTTILASNTSALSISELGSVAKKPDKVVGMHFFNPAHVMKLIEVIPGLQTSDETVDDVISFSESLRKIPVRVNECAGFLVNRILMSYINEAFYALQEGAAGVKEIDEAMVSFGMPMGPFTLVDMLGLDVADSVADILYNSYGERMKPAALIKRITASGRLGTKSGKGIYDYSDEKKDDLFLENAIKETQKETGISNTEFSVHRLLLPMINEAAISFQERVSTLSDIDIAMLAGTGFPQDKGGPLHYADSQGLDNILKEMEKFNSILGQRFWPAPIFKRYVAAGCLGVKAKKGFFDYL